MDNLRLRAVLVLTGMAVPILSGPALSADYIFNKGALIGLSELSGLSGLSELSGLSGFSAAPDPIIELAGGDDTDPATPRQLRDAGTEMVPDSNLKKSSANPKPIQLMAEPKKPAPAMQPSPAPEPQPIIQAQPVSEPAPISEPPAKRPDVYSDVYSGPYVRLDAGYGYAMGSDGSQSAGTLTSGSISNAAVVGGGLGYRFGEKFRTDIVLDYHFDAGVSSTTAAGNTASTEVDGVSVMLNGYWDVAKVDAFTPYVGAGVGYAHLSTPVQTTTGGTANEAGDSSDNIAWALTVGSAIELNTVFSLDLNYRFIDLGEFKQATSTLARVISATLWSMYKLG